MNINWRELLIINLSDTWSLNVIISPVLVFVMLIVLISFYKKRNRFEDWQVIEAEVRLGGIGKVKIKPSYEDIQVAHQAWVELATRKAGIIFDEKHDVIIEVYDSWYELFKEMRNLTKQIPADKIRNNESTKELVQILVESLNDGLRPHLTCWQAKFRRWYEIVSEKYPGKTPQEIQRDYPQYKELVEDLKRVNWQLIEYTNFIKRIGHGDKISKRLFFRETENQV